MEQKREPLFSMWEKKVAVKGQETTILTFTDENGKKRVAWLNKSDNPKAPKWRVYPDTYVGKAPATSSGSQPITAHNTDLPF